MEMMNKIFIIMFIELVVGTMSNIINTKRIIYTKQFHIWFAFGALVINPLSKFYGYNMFYKKKCQTIGETYSNKFVINVIINHKESIHYFRYRNYFYFF